MIGLLALGCVDVTWCRAAGTSLHTSWNARWQGTSCAVGEAELTRTIEGIDARLSVWNDASEVVALHRATGPTPVHQETAEVVRGALDLAAATGGAFDPTIEPLMNAWGFHGDGEPSEPSQAELSAALRRVGWGAVRFSRTPAGPTIDPGGRQLDVSALLEGHAADRMALALARLGSSSHLVQVGDEVRLAGLGPHGPWHLGVPGTDVVLQLTNHGLGIAGSPGDERRSTLDPSTGALSSSDARVVAVVAPTAEQADGLATAVSVLGAVAGLALIEHTLDTEALVVLPGGEVRRTSGFEVFLARPTP